MTLMCSHPPADNTTLPRGECLRNVKRFRGGLVFKAHRLGVSLNGLRVIQKKKKKKKRVTNSFATWG